MYGPGFYALPFAHALGVFFLPLLAVLLVWELVIKGFALWRAARNRQKWWFVFVLILNTVGILPLVYLIWFSKPEPVSAPAVDSSTPDA